LKAKKIVQLPNHAHLKFLLHFFRKLMGKRVKGSSKNDVVHIYLSNEFLSTLFFDERGLISLSPCKSLSQEISGERLIPCPRSLLKPI
jgi:hypothetical protein